jgi:DNA-directed RNA polymerase subunit M/transcription elongation factor TFIIS
MSQNDINQQWRDLQESYAAVADEELESLAHEAYDLTDIARQALQAEISRRQLDVELLLRAPATDDASVSEDEGSTQDQSRSPNRYPEGFDPEDWGLVSFSHAADIEQARKLKECFDAAGIPSYYGPDVVDDLGLLPSGFKGSLEVKVREVDLHRARAARNKCAPAEAAEVFEDLSDYSAHCPKCHSTEIVFRKLEKSKTEPNESTKFSWKCYGCGYRWKDDGIES